MNWHEMIAQFHIVNINDLPDFASERDKELAVDHYNKAVGHISRDSADIALIALRRLASGYPKFGLASFLAACLLADDGQYEESEQLLNQALNQGLLSESDSERARLCQLHVDRLRASAGQDTGTAEHPVHNLRSVLNTAAVLERIKRSSKVTMASERERQNVMRQGDGGEQETMIENRRNPMEYLRFGLPILIVVLLIGFLIFAGMRWLPRLGIDNDQASASAVKLEWLLTRLEELAEENQNIDQLLAAYNRTFAESGPSATPAESSAAGQTTTSEPAATTAEPIATESEAEPTPTPEPTTDPNINLLNQAEESFLSAQNLLDQDVMAAADQLFAAQSILEALPNAATNPDTGLRADQLYEDVMSQLDDIALAAANRFRETGRRLFDQGEYEQALIPYLKGFALDPGNYRGGLAYYCGRSYQLLDRYDEAKPYFEYVIEQFPNRDIADYSKNRLREMGF